VLRKKRSKELTLSVLERRLTRLEKKFQTNPNDDDQTDIRLIKEDINNIFQDKINGCIIRSKMDWQEHGEKPSKFFLSLEKRNYNNKTIKRVRNNDGTVYSDEKLILKELYNFYSKLYKTSHDLAPDFSDLDNLILPRLCEAESAACEGLLTLEEILKVLKTCKSNKSPGTDGFSSEFYTFFWLDIKDYLLDAMNYNYIKQNMSISLREGLITLIPKKDKDTLLIKIWRPITLLNQDYKLVTKAIATRLCTVLPKIINSDQTGFLKNRYIGENIIRLTNIMDFLDESNEAALLLSVDFEKAFDCLEWKFVEYCLCKFNFGRSLIQWIKLFYTDIITRVSNNGWVTDIFYPSRGSRQGCPLSPYIFLICAEILACLLRNNNNIHGIKIENINFLVSQYADDTLITLKYSEENLKAIIKVFELYAKLSGLKVNYNKSLIMPLGRIKYNYEVLVPDCRFQWTEGPLQSLGVLICHRTEDLLKLNYTKSLKKMETMLKIWGKRYLTLYGKVTVINTFVISQLVYLLSVLPSPSDEILTHINLMIFDFIWNKKPDKIKRDVMKLPKEHGGLSVPDIFIKNFSLKIAWVQRIIKNDNSWNIMLARYLPISLNFIWKLNININDVQILTKNIPNQFMRQIISAWSIYNFHDPPNIHHVRKQIIWFNSHVKVDGGTIFIQALYNRNILFIHQFFNIEGNPLTLVEFQREYGIHIHFLTYHGIISAIPRKWKIDMKHHNIVEMVPFVYKPLENIERKDHVCKFVYRDMITKFYIDCIPSGYRTWHEYLPDNLSLESWKRSFEIMYNTLRCTKTLLVQFKILHCTIATREKLYKWHIINTDLCAFCEEEIGTLPHLLVECEVIKIFWQNVHLWFARETDIHFYPSSSEIILGLENSELIILNTIYMLAKRYIYNCSYKQEFPNIESFIIFFFDYIRVEKNIAVRNNRMTEFLEKWNDLLPLE